MAYLRMTLILVLSLSAAHALPGNQSTTEDESAIRATDLKWSQAANISHLDEFLSFYAEGASVLPFNGPMVSGRSQIRQFFSQLFSKPGFAVTFAPTKIEVSKSRDVAYEIGTAQLTTNDAQGQPATTPAKYVVVWKRDADQNWKAVADIFNTYK
jgi:uncharacterized protein (TIGR02246 family)